MGIMRDSGKFMIDKVLDYFYIMFKFLRDMQR